MQTFYSIEWLISSRKNKPRMTRTLKLSAFAQDTVSAAVALLRTAFGSATAERTPRKRKS
jgi:hypothetical protein